jgi:flagellar basal body L-ring protein FlgH
LVRDYPGKVQAYFHKVSHDGKAECAAELTINGKKTFTVNLGGKQQTITLHGIARPGDPMSFFIRQIVEQELAKARKEVKDAEAIKKSEPPSS